MTELLANLFGSIQVCKRILRCQVSGTVEVKKHWQLARSGLGLSTLPTAQWSVGELGAVSSNMWVASPSKVTRGVSCISLLWFPGKRKLSEFEFSMQEARRDQVVICNDANLNQN